MALLKLKARELKVGEFYLAYSAKSKKLSRYGKAGVIVEYLGATKIGANTIKVQLDNGKFFEMNLANLDTRKDAFMLPVNEKTIGELNITLGDEGGFFPAYTPLMKEHVANKQLIKFTSLLKPDERFPEDKRDGTATLIFSVAGRDRPLFLNNGQVRILDDVLSMVCTAEELEAKKRAEEAARLAKLKEGGVKLVVGKQELGKKLMPSLLEQRKQFMKAEKQHQGSCASFALLYGKEMDGKLEYWDYQNAPCHAQLCRRNQKGDPIQFVLSSPRKNNYGTGDKKNFNLGEQDREFIDYLINRSPYADVFIDKDVDSVIKYGYLCNGNAPSNAVCAALTASRQTWEYPSRPAAFNLLRKYMPENLAYFVCMSASGSFNADGTLSSLRFDNQHTGHTPLDHVCMSNEQVFNLMYDNIVLPNEDLLEARSYSSPNRVHSLFGNSQKVAHEERNTLTHNLGNLQYPTPKASTNPFDIPKTGVDVAVEKAVECVQQWREAHGDI